MTNLCTVMPTGAVGSSTRTASKERVPRLWRRHGGIVELYGALNSQPALAGFVIEELIVEAQAEVDKHPGGRRNHDLVLRGRLANGDGAVVCIEAKAGESLGQRLVGQRAVGRAVTHLRAEALSPHFA